MPNARRRQKRASIGSSRPAAQERQELAARRGVIAEGAAHGAGRADALRLSDAADRHAGVSRLQHHADAACPCLLHQQVRQLLGHALLHLRPVRQHLDNSRQLAQPDDAPLWQIANVRLAHERQEMVFAHAGKFDVLDDHDLIVLLREALAEEFARVGVQPTEQLGVHAGDASRSIAQALAVGVLADRDKDLTDGRLDARLVNRLVLGRAAVLRLMATHENLHANNEIGPPFPCSAARKDRQARRRARFQALLPDLGILLRYITTIFRSRRERCQPCRTTSTSCSLTSTPSTTGPPCPSSWQHWSAATSSTTTSFPTCASPSAGISVFRSAAETGIRRG